MAEEETREERRRRWEAMVSDWKESGVSGAQWCREHGVKYELFLYHKRRLSPPHGEFVEIKDRTSGVALEIEGALIRVDPSFDAQTLKRVIKALTC